MSQSFISYCVGRVNFIFTNLQKKPAKHLVMVHAL